MKYWLSICSHPCHRQPSHWQCYLWEVSACTHSSNSPRECLESDQLLFPSHSAPLLKHEGNSHPHHPLLTLLPLPLAPHTELWERKQIKWKQWEILHLILHCHLSPDAAPAKGKARASWCMVICHRILPLPIFPPLSIQELEKWKTKALACNLVNASHQGQGCALPPSMYSTFSKGIAGLHLPKLITNESQVQECFGSHNRGGGED